MSADVKCLVVNLPHNPSGWLPTREEWAHIVDCAAAVRTATCSAGLCSEYLPAGVFVHSSQQHQPLQLHHDDGFMVPAG